MSLFETLECHAHRFRDKELRVNETTGTLEQSPVQRDMKHGFTFEGFMFWLHRGCSCCSKDKRVCLVCCLFYTLACFTQHVGMHYLLNGFRHGETMLIPLCFSFLFVFACSAFSKLHSSFLVSSQTRILLCLRRFTDPYVNKDHEMGVSM